MFKKKEKYYSLKNILKTESTYNLIVGERSNGKTYSTLKYCIEEYFNNGGEFAIVRRWQTDIRGKRASQVFDGLIDNNEIENISGGKYTGIYYYGGKYYLCSYDENGKPLYNDNDVIAYPFALSDVEHNKGNSYPRIKNIVFDEFITRQVYLPDEFMLFMNTVSTIVRQRTDVKIFMLGNTVNKYNPYFKEMGLNEVTQQKQGTIDLYKYGNSNLKVAVEYCASLKKSKKNNFYFAFNNPKLEMITSGAWELDLYPHCPIKYQPKHILFTYFIVFEEQIFQCEIVQKDIYLFTFIHRKTTPIKNTESDLIYSLEINSQINYNNNIYNARNKIENKIKSFYINKKVFYQDNEVGDTIENYLKMCRGTLY